MCAICGFRMEFGVSDPQALTVAVATRDAVAAGALPELIFDGALGNMKMRAAAIVTPRALQSRMETTLAPAKLAALPDFYVLLVESGTWGFFHATPDGFDPVPDTPDVLSEDQAERDIVPIAAETTVRSILDGEFEFERTLREQFIVLDAGATSARVQARLSGRLSP